MKKGFALGLTAFSFVLALTSCTGNQADESTQYDNPDTTVYGMFSFANNADWTQLHQFEGDATDYTTVKFNPAKDLYVIYTDLDALFEAHGNLAKSVTISTLAFTDLREDTKSSLIGELYNEEYGIKESTIGLNENQTLNVKSYALGNIDLAIAKDKYDNNEKGNVLAVVYLPVYLNQKKAGKTYAVSNVLVPVYYELTTKASFNDDGYTEIDAKTILEEGSTKLKNKAE